MVPPAVPNPVEPHLTSAPRRTTGRGRGARGYCSGDPHDLAGDAHLWSEFGENDQGTLYRCDVCGVTDELVRSGPAPR
ncbi:hypothetical protein FAF44_28135 [Nonomuraea sp. MG754425]|uniref:hypothetical protein n=1 Tax=Nonomuraea sp. MG754425 TaxID=2570319 RepID=UPI001F259E3C|nr:hypothetical protein [Nonomuraea sp. MG754425]MCF6472234.1 hypothetical protein [Nonomuraea sp. MG754425]